MGARPVIPPPRPYPGFSTTTTWGLRRDRREPNGRHISCCACGCACGCFLVYVVVVVVVVLVLEIPLNLLLRLLGFLLSWRSQMEEGQVGSLEYIIVLLICSRIDLFWWW